MARTGLDATLTLSDKLAASGAGSASVRAPGDITVVKREGAGAFDLIETREEQKQLLPEVR